MRALVLGRISFSSMLTLLLLPWSHQAHAQLPVSDFSVPPTLCLNERLPVVNSSQEAVSHMWDFCEGDLYQTPTGSIFTSLSASLNPKEMHVVRDGEFWFGFVTSRTNNSLFRINFGTNPANTNPSVTNLGNIGNLFSSPEQVKLIKENGNWFGLVVNGSTGTLVRLTFGTSLDSTPGGQIILSGVSSANGGMDIGAANGQVVAVITNASTQVVRIVNFANSITNNPTSADVLTVSAPGGASQLEDITLIQKDGIWYGFMLAFNSRGIYRLTFGPSLFSIPTFVGITPPPFVIEERPSGIRIKEDMGKFVGYVQTFAGTLFRLDFGNSITNTSPASTRIGNLGTLANSVNFELIKHNSRWYSYVINQTTRSITRVDFPDNCPANQPVSSDFEPYGIAYSAPGTYHISLTVSDQNNNHDYSSASIIVSGDQAPDIDYSSQNICANHDVEFASMNNSGNIVSYDWDFGDTNTSSQASPTHVFAVAGEYPVQLNVAADNGCLNFVRRNISIFNEPQADFVLPSSNPICSNQAYTFTNTTTFDQGSSPIWQWSVNDVAVSSEQHLEFTFPDAIPQELKLVSSIPGCESERIQTIASISEGPLVDFGFTGQCEDEPIVFTNGTTGSVTEYNWDFDDGQSSSVQNPQHAFADPDQYMVTLTASNAAGCNNMRSKLVSAYSKPQTNFSIPLPPFSCNGLPTQFTDLTPNPFDSNLSSWSWNFDDGGTTSTERNPQHTYSNSGNYQVSLTVTTNFGCSTTLQKGITIATSPVPDFTTTALCRSVPVTFVDASSGNIQSRLWQIESASFTLANPVYTFNTSGTKPVTLTVTDANGCISSTSRNLNVPMVLTPDFSVWRNCVNQQTEFTDITNDATDPVASRLWTFTGFGSGTDNPQSFTFTNPGNYSVRLTLTTQTGCEYSLQKNTAIVAGPQALFTASPMFGAPPLLVQFTNTSTQASQYLWEFGDAESSTSDLPSPSFTFNELGEYEVRLTAGNSQGCLNATSRIIEAVIPDYDVRITNLELLPAPNNAKKPAVTIQNRGNVAVTDLPVRFDFPGGSSVREQIPNTIAPGETFRYLAGFDLPGASQSGYVCAEIEFADYSIDDNRLCTGVGSGVLVIEPYPNPVVKPDEINLEWIFPEQQVLSVTLVNTIGQTVNSWTIQPVQGYNWLKLPTEQLQSGVYFIRIESGNFTSASRILILE